MAGTDGQAKGSDGRAAWREAHHSPFVCRNDFDKAAKPIGETKFVCGITGFLDKSFCPPVQQGNRARRRKRALHDQLHHVLDDIVIKVDRAATAVSLEARAPFFDHHLVEFSRRLPLSAKLDSPGGKLILRRLLRRHLPEAIIDRPKMGFSVPWRTGFGDRWAAGRRPC